MIATSKLTSLGCQWRSCNTGNYDSLNANSESSESDSRSNLSKKSEVDMKRERIFMNETCNE